MHDTLRQFRYVELYLHWYQNGMNDWLGNLPSRWFRLVEDCRQDPREEEYKKEFSFPEGNHRLHEEHQRGCIRTIQQWIMDVYGTENSQILR